jgi:hypothetical protein
MKTKLERLQQDQVYYEKEKNSSMVKLFQMASPSKYILKAVDALIENLEEFKDRFCR